MHDHACTHTHAHTHTHTHTHTHMHTHTQTQIDKNFIFYSENLEDQNLLPKTTETNRKQNLYFLLSLFPGKYIKCIVRYKGSKTGSNLLLQAMSTLVITLI